MQYCSKFLSKFFIYKNIAKTNNNINLNDIFTKSNENANNIPKNLNVISEETSVNISNGTLGNLKSVPFV